MPVLAFALALSSGVWIDYLSASRLIITLRISAAHPWLATIGAVFSGHCHSLWGIAYAHIIRVRPGSWRKMEDSNPRWSITTPMSVFRTAAIATRQIFRIAGLRCQRTALQSKDCLRQTRGDFNPDPLRRRTRCCSSSLPFDNMNNTTQLQKAAVVPMAGVEPAPSASLCLAALRLLSYTGISECFSCSLFFRVARFKAPRLFFRRPL